MVYLHIKRTRKHKKEDNIYGYLYLREKNYKRDKRTLKRKKNYRIYNGDATKDRGRYSKTKDLQYLGKIIYPKKIENIDFEEYLLKNKGTNFSQFLITNNYETIIKTYQSYLKEILGAKDNENYVINDGVLSEHSIQPLLQFEFRINENTSARSESDRFAKIYKRSGFHWDETELRTYLLKLKVDEAIKKSDTNKQEDIETETPPEVAGKVPTQQLDEFYKEWYGDKYEKSIKKITEKHKNGS